MGNHPGVAETGWGNRMSKQLDWRHVSSCSVSVRHSNRCRCTGSNLWALRPSCTACSRHRGAWAVSLSRGLGTREDASRDGKPNIEPVRRLVHRSGGELVMGGRRVRVARPRARTLDGREVELPSWRTFGSSARACGCSDGRRHRVSRKRGGNVVARCGIDGLVVKWHSSHPLSDTAQIQVDGNPLTRNTPPAGRLKITATSSRMPITSPFPPLARRD